ncbi:glycosyltransferase [Tunicatimonas pelagia]|uniref:glycosyltransferase n=1 Tax=Tunicatimonas pelagia TaxID=931531 RepID=UPI002665E413|nr:glycosyltransferase [Tunicatimonas pelagia]WKN44706.1 glycosyltransferase [Tunicatimonas pelagia]
MAWTAISREYYVINSEADRSIYHQHLGIPNHKLVSLPYGDFSSADIEDEEVRAQVGSYYFAGGFTNRDYASLIDAFRELNQKLVIVGSHLNRDLQVELPSNVQVLRDIPKKQFNTLIKNAKACILPLKEETGASGQMVLLSYMKQAKAVIVPHMQITHEYLDEGTSALFYSNAQKEIPSIIRYLDQDERKIVDLGIAANKQYNRDLGGDTIKEKLYKIVTDNLPQSAIEIKTEEKALGKEDYVY